MISFSKLFRSFRHAGSGIMETLKTEQNFKIHVLCGILIFIFALFTGISNTEYIAIIISVSILLILEIINTALEKVIDIIKPRVHQYAADIKDILAGAVLLSALSCAIVVLFVFMPYILKYLSNF